MLEAINLRKQYETKIRKNFFKSEKQTFEAVKDVSLKIDKGQIIGLLGINGAGKTTTIKMLTTLLSPTSGQYFLDGIDGVKNPRMIKSKVNMIAGGERMIYWRLTAYENLWYYGQLYGIENNELKQRIDYLLKLVGLYENRNKKVEDYSKGMKQRLQIARGLINDPEYIFMDEPTLGLDAIVARDLRHNVRMLAKKRKKGILLTSHYMGEVEELCDYIYVLDKGRIIEQGTVKDLSSEVFNKVMCKLTVYNDDKYFYERLLKKLKEIDKTVEVINETEGIRILSSINLSLDISKYCADCAVVIKEFYEIEPSLEDTIIKLSKVKED